MSIQKRIRAVIRKPGSQYMKTKPQLSRRILKLDAGENLWIPRVAKQEMRRALREVALDMYPEPEATKLCVRIAEVVGVDPSWVMVGNGSDELIDLCCRIFLNPGDTLIDFPPTFPMYWFFARIMGAKLLEVPRCADFTIDIDAAVGALKKAKLAFVATPNNPTGTLTSRDEIVRLLATGKPVVVDEAYIEFGGTSVIDLVQQFDNLIVLRTFSKWAGIAGVRIGILIAQPTVVDAIKSMRPPYSVNTVAQRVALAALDNRNVILPLIEELKESRDVFIRMVDGMNGIRVVPSRASCVLLLLNSDARKMADCLARRRIIVKPLMLPSLQPALRVSVAPKTQMRRVISALRQCSTC